MNIKIERSILFNVLNMVCNVVEKRQTLPILANLYFKFSDGRLNIIGTDLEVEMSVVIENIQGEPWEFTISSRKILDITKRLPENALVTLKRDNDNILVLSGRSRYVLKTLDAEDFPRIDTTNWEKNFKIKELYLNSLFYKTSFAMAVQDVRYYLNGVLFEMEKNTLRAIATDGHRLAQSEVDINLDIEETRRLIIPRKAVIEIDRLIDGNSEQEITIEINKNHLKITKDETTLITKLIDGKFPEFKNALDGQTDVFLTVDKTQFIDTMNRVSVLTTERFKGVSFALEAGLIRVTASNAEQEEAVEELEVEYTGKNIKMGYNISYLIDAARVIQTRNIDLHFQENDSRCILKEPGDDRSVWLVMPMRV